MKFFKKHPRLMEIALITLCCIGYSLIAVQDAAAPPPPPPPPPVPAGNLFTEYLAGMGIAAYGTWHYWRGKRAANRKGKHENQ